MHRGIAWALAMISFLSWPSAVMAQNDVKERMDAAWASGQTTRAFLTDHIPVHLIYGTAFKGDAGSIEFRPDVYGRDRKLYNALFGRPTS